MSEAAIHLLVGTTKGAFVLDGDAERSRWAVRGPYCDGWPINHVIGDPATGTIWAGGGGDWSGAGVWRSDDGGRTWQLTKLTTGQMDAWAADDPAFAESIGWTEAPAPFGDALLAGVVARRGSAPGSTRAPSRRPCWSATTTARRGRPSRG